MKKILGVFAIIALMASCSHQKKMSADTRKNRSIRHMDSVAQGGDIMKRSN